MKTRFRLDLNKAINVLVVLLLCSFTIFSTYTWGRYVMLGCITVVLCVQLWRDNGKYKLKLPMLVVIMLPFIAYTLISSLWAERPMDSITMSRTLLEIMVMKYVLYNCYSKNSNFVTDLFACIKWCSYIVSLYSILFYGIDFLIQAANSGLRLDNEYANVNTIGMLAAIGSVIQIDEIIRDKKWKWSALLCIPSIAMVALTQSRKALIVLILGILLCFVFRNFDSKNILKTLLKLLVVLPVIILLIYGILSLPIFSGVMERINSLLESAEAFEEGSSAFVRQKMVEIGWEQFLKTPLFGMGIDNPHILSATYLGHDAYLHNNYIELLAGGGIVGVALYYAMYVYLIVIFWKYRKYANKEYVVSLVLMILLLLLDFGMVAYYQKTRYIYLMTLFMEAEALKKNARKNQLEG